VAGARHDEGSEAKREADFFLPLEERGKRERFIVHYLTGTG